MKRVYSSSACPLLILAAVLFFPHWSISFAGQVNLSANELKMSAPAEVVSLTVRGTNALCYELTVSDVSTYGLRLKSVEILDGGPNGAVLKSYTGRVLSRSLRKPADGIRSNVIFVWVRQSPGTPVPQALFHRVGLKHDDSGETVTVEGAPVSVKGNTGIVLKPPFTGSGWTALETASRSLSHHRKGLIQFMGKTYLSQRYAIDWLKLGPNGLFWKTDGSSNEDYYCYGKPLLAVENGVVVDARDGVPENVPDPSGSGETAVPITFGTMGGNYVVLKIGEGVYAHYCHMIPGTVGVMIGDEVKAGDVLGKLGNSGNSTGPHLHFQISDSADTLRSDGLPYVFEAYVLQGAADLGAQADYPAFHGMDIETLPNEKLFVEDYPLNGSIVRFRIQELSR